LKHFFYLKNDIIDVMKNDKETAKVIKDTLFTTKRSFILRLLSKKNVFLTITKSDKMKKNK
jgi:hypothetical protein